MYVINFCIIPVIEHLLLCITVKYGICKPVLLHVASKTRYFGLRGFFRAYNFSYLHLTSSCPGDGVQEMDFLVRQGIIQPKITIRLMPFFCN